MTLATRLADPLDPTTTRVLLVRHAEPDGDEGRCYGRTDLPLSARGREQAGSLASAFGGAASTRLTIQSVVASSLRRARETAEPLALALGLPTVVDARLEEIDFGEWEGEPHTTLAQRFSTSYRQWMREPMSFRFPGGESFTDLRIRVLGAFEEIVRAHAGGVAVIVAHGGVIRTLVADALSVSTEHLFRIACDHAHVTWLDVAPAYAVVQALNVPPAAFR